MVERGEMGDFGAAWRQGHGHPVGSVTRGLTSRVPRTASRLEMQPEEPVVASSDPAKTATLTMLPCA